MIEALEKRSGYENFMKDLVTKKRSVTLEDYYRLRHWRAFSTRWIVKKKEDPRGCIILCTIRLLPFVKALCYLYASINLMQLLIYKKLGLQSAKPRVMRLIMDDTTIKSPLVCSKMYL